MAEELRSISDARRDLTKLSQAAQKSMDRYIITNQGQPQSVLLGWEEYQGMKAAVELLNRPEALASLEEGLKDLREGRRLTFEEMQRDLRRARADEAGGQVPEVQAVGKISQSDSPAEGIQFEIVEVDGSGRVVGRDAAAVAAHGWRGERARTK